MGMGIQTIRVGDPTQAAGGDAGELEGDAVAIAQFLGAIFEKANQGPVDVAEAEEAEVVGADGIPRAGAKARSIYVADAALKRRSSTVLYTRLCTHRSAYAASQRRFPAYLAAAGRSRRWRTGVSAPHKT
jgi:hypothetical protein